MFLIRFFIVDWLLAASFVTSIQFTLRSQLESNLLEALDSTEKELSTELSKIKDVTKLKSVSPKNLKSLYFHIEDLSVQVTDMQLTSSEPILEQTNMDVLGHRMVPVVTFHWAEIKGKLKAGVGNKEPHKFDFSLVQEKLKGKGVVSLTADLINVTWSYIYFRPNSTSCEIKGLNDSADPILSKVLKSSNFSELLSTKLQRDISYQLTETITKTINENLWRSSKLKDLQPYADEISAIGINNTENANLFIDNILKVGGTLIRQKFGDRIKIPDIEEGFATKVLVTFKGSFRATDGVAVGTSSVSRIGDVIFGYNNESLLHFYGALGFQDLHLHYGYYKAEMWGMGPSGSLDTSLAPLRVLAHVFLNTTSKMITLSKLKIISVGDLTVTLTGLGGMMDWLISRVTTWVVGMYRDQVLQLLESQYEQYLKDVFSSYTLEELLNGGKNENFVMK
ncbi:uncharacterized protein LOC129003680 [Macrosteles quadrilineatus]|uniref:uncharacterized protein LOC129003680 n=1 Tax=Macrosteles quadrilineatus TaxID=74068 RepID=UPI0023E310BD|nr:uncharacterized protein LOC129003680 [Macrosteles quadrilineatus]